MAMFLHMRRVVRLLALVPSIDLAGSNPEVLFGQDDEAVDIAHTDGSEL
jgi:hypothetical protein